MSRGLFTCLGVGVVAAFPSLCAAQKHPEILVGHDGSGKLAVRIEGPSPIPLSASRFPGVDGYADAMPGYSSMFEAKEGDRLFKLDTQPDILFVLVDADEGVAAWNDRGTDRMRLGESFRLGPPPFDSHPLWNIVSVKARKSYALRMHLRDAKGRYKDSDVFALEFAPDDTTERYVCPMACKGGAYFKEAGRCPECGMHLKLLSGRNYRVSVTPEGMELEGGRIRPGVESTLRFRITAPDGKPVTLLEIVHEKLLHLLMVSNDLAWFAHEHPTIQADGSFTLAFTFPHGGAYTLYHDFTPPRVGMQVVPVEIQVLGDSPPAAPLTVSKSRAQTVDGYTVELRTASPVKSIQMQSLAFRVSRAGGPVRDLEPFLGAMGHLIMISQDRKNFVHSHPLEPLKGNSSERELPNGPEVVFNAQFPVPGLYKAWGQFQHQGRVITAPFVFEVLSPIGASAKPLESAPGKQPGR